MFVKKLFLNFSLNLEYLYWWQLVEAGNNFSLLSKRDMTHLCKTTFALCRSKIPYLLDWASHLRSIFLKSAAPLKRTDRDSIFRGGPLEKWWGGGNKNKIRAGKTNKKKNSCTRNVWKKKFVQRLFNRENNKLVCILYIYNYKVQCKGVPQPRSQGFHMRTRRDTRKPWSGPVNFAFWLANYNTILSKNNWTWQLTILTIQQLYFYDSCVYENVLQNNLSK